MCKIREMIRKAKSVLESNVGEGYIDTAVKMIIAVVIGGRCRITGACGTYPGYVRLTSVNRDRRARRLLSRTVIAVNKHKNKNKKKV